MWAAVQSWDGSAPAPTSSNGSYSRHSASKADPAGRTSFCVDRATAEAAMRFLNQCILGAVVMLAVFVGCSKKATESPAPAAVSESTMPTQGTQPVQAVNAQQVQQVNANWDAVSKDIAAQNYDNAVRA